MDERYAELEILIKKDGGEFTPAQSVDAVIDLYRVESFYRSPEGDHTCVHMYSGDFYNVNMTYVAFRRLYRSYADKKIQLFA